MHGDLSAVSILALYVMHTFIIFQANVLLDSEFHCHITDFGLTRQFESTIAQSTTAISINYAAPELLGMCPTCCMFECNGCSGQGKGKTMQTDVYAYGCVYYAVNFPTVLAVPQTVINTHPGIL